MQFYRKVSNYRRKLSISKKMSTSTSIQHPVWCVSGSKLLLDPYKWYQKLIALMNKHWNWNNGKRCSGLFHHSSFRTNLTNACSINSRWWQNVANCQWLLIQYIYEAVHCYLHSHQHRACNVNGAKYVHKSRKTWNLNTWFRSPLPRKGCFFSLFIAALLFRMNQRQNNR